LGGSLGWALAHFAPERFQAIIIGGAGPRGEDVAEMAGVLQEMGGEGFARAHLENMRNYQGKLRPEIYEAYVGNDMDAVALAGIELSAYDAWVDLPELGMPILLVAGRSDEEFADTARAADALPNGQLLALSNLDHVGTFLASEQIIPEIIAFLDQDPS
jgi:pimeloyl-ACP methyl ester carboxylesterase